MVADRERWRKRSASPVGLAKRADPYKRQAG